MSEIETRARWPDPCACGHSGFTHHLQHNGREFGPEMWCKGGRGPCGCVEYRPAVRETSQ